MNGINEFISELVRAANQVDKLGDFEKKRLLDRSVATIREMRRAIGIPSSGTTHDEVIDLQTVAAKVGAIALTSSDVRSSLLNAAGMIRDLHIIIDTNVDIVLGNMGR
ncbi:hypothetical protein EQW76_00610 [Rhizobium sp. rho-13.1]|uniref:hypothetical protein n=1 Tax=Rhizobium sp. rho-13.1 TaxID=2506431 RepID=UPI00115DC716|nr:hypothetical protein [Rhizobium sp. rho-13.1]TQX91276.1 hypothetical protein EQW76_00610 [Rhizobium sp. rho-13.1]